MCQLISLTQEKRVTNTNNMQSMCLSLLNSAEGEAIISESPVCL